MPTDEKQMSRNRGEKKEEKELEENSLGKRRKMMLRKHERRYTLILSSRTTLPDFRVWRLQRLLLLQHLAGRSFVEEDALVMQWFEFPQV